MIQNMKKTNLLPNRWVMPIELREDTILPPKLSPLLTNMEDKIISTL